MNLLLDTNILIYIAKDQSQKLLSNLVNPDNEMIFISVCTVAELKSIAIQNNWGNKKLQVIDSIIQEAVIVEINESMSDTYAQIDAYSQKRNPSYQNYHFNTPRNMGKNDLWIASTAALLGLKLITTDADFNHLHRIFFEVQFLNPIII